MKKKRTKKEMISLIARFIEELKKVSIDKTVTTSEFSPQKWFRDHGINNRSLPARVVEYLSNHVLVRGGTRTRPTYEWVEKDFVNFRLMAESCYDFYLKEPIEQPEYIEHQGLSMDDKVYVVADNKIVQVKIIGLQRIKPYTDKSGLMVTVFKDDPRFPIELNAIDVFKDINELIHKLTENVD